MNPLLAFYRDDAPDDRGRRLDRILQANDDWLEHTHDFVQWLFPLPERSGANPGAPVLDEATIAAFRADARLRERLDASFARMLAFYGLAREHGRVVPGPNWAERRGNWFLADTHNNLRITRILRSLTLLGKADDARALLEALIELKDEEPDCGVGMGAWWHWARAVRG